MLQNASRPACYNLLRSPFMISSLPLENKVAVVTGASRGIGRAIAEVLAKAGADVVCGDRLEKQAEETAAEVAAMSGRRTSGCLVDVADYKSAQDFIACALENFGKVDILVNNAGITRDNLMMRIDEKDWDEVLTVNLKGAYNCSKAAIRPMMKQRYGRIVNITSVVG